MANPVTVKFRDGTERKFEDRGRPGGGYRVEYGAWHVTIIDCFGKRSTFPLDLVKEVVECPTCY